MRLEDYSGPVWAGTSRLEVVGDTPTLHKLHDLVNKVAHERLDPQRPAAEQPSLEHRKVAALGAIADGAGATSKTKLYVHPRCDRPSRDCDLDHIEAFVEMDDGGPPGQTRPDNLAPLCRRHHRAKTHQGWSYQRNANGSYTWTSPHGHRLTRR